MYENGENNPNYRHGIGHGRIYRIYSNMKQRCNNPNNHKYAMYGGRGIKVCPEWNNPHGLKAFFDWAMKNGYSDELTIDRIDTNGDYTPTNCRWVTPKEQAENTRRNIFISVDGQSITITEFERKYHMSRAFIKKYLRKGWDADKIIEWHKNPECAKSRPCQKVEYGGETLSFREWGKRMGIKPSIIRDRVASGWSVEKAITTPQLRKRKRETHETCIG